MKIVASIEKPEVNSVATMVSHTLHSATIAHFIHLTTGSYSEHMALGDYYENIVGIVDQFVEAYNGRNKKIKTYPTDFAGMPASSIQYLTELRDEVEMLRTKPDFPQYSSAQNEVDNIVNCIDGTLYKLKELK